MNRLEINRRVRANTRDLSNSIFRESDIIDWINEGIDRIKQLIPEMEGMTYLLESDSIPSYLPSQYHHLLAVYTTSRCFGQDERHYQATTYMNEFEAKLDELKQKIESGDISITDPDGNPVDSGGENTVEYVKDIYFEKNYYGEE